MQVPQSAQHMYNLIDGKKEAVLLGHLQEMVSSNGEFTRAVMKVLSLQIQGEDKSRPAEGFVQLSMRGTWPENILPGEMFLVRGNVKRPRSFHTPGAFDYARYLAQKDIWITGFIRSPLFITKVDEQKTVTQQLKYLHQRVRTHIGSFLDINLQEDKAAAYRALLLGDRSRVSEDTLELFKAGGVFHILAISGLHLSVIAVLLYAMLYFLLSRSEKLLLYFPVKKIVAFLTIPLLVVYAMLAGMNSPVTRAVIMSSIVLIALCSDRKKSPAALVSIAALIILIQDPNTLFTVSFQLSFAAISAILLTIPLLEKILKKEQQGKQQRPVLLKLGQYILSLFVVSIAATLATAPFSISTFHRISFVGPLANIFVEPLICLWTLPAGMISLVTMGTLPQISCFFLNVGYSAFDLTLNILGWLTRFPFANVYMATPPTLFYLCFFLCCFAGFFFSISRSWKTRTIVSAATLLPILLFSSLPLLKKPQTSTVSFIDLGQGSSTFIETPNKRILIDGGGSSFSDKRVGETVIAPFLWSQGIGNIDTVIITHPDSDHYNGLQFIIDHFAPREIWLRDTQGHDRDYKNLIENAADQGITLITGEAGVKITDKTFQLHCIENLYETDFNKTTQSGASNGGLILQACFDTFCFLFPGDINKKMEHDLLRRKADLGSQVLLAAHHGAKTSNSLPFLAAVRPSYTVVSSARSSTGYFPHASFLRKCKQQGIRVFTTQNDGTIEFKLAPQMVQINGSTKFKANPLYPLQTTSIQSLTRE
jgi:competence protein ComEC